MGGCSCGLLERATATNYGGRLQFIWSDANNYGKFDTPRQWCNPMNCSNTACYKKGCSAARANFCAQHGIMCASLGRKICTSDKCPGGGLCCEPQAAKAAITGKPWCPESNLKACSPVPVGCIDCNTGGTKPSGSNPPTTGNCAQGNFYACISEMGDAFGKFWTDAFRSGGQNAPLYMMLAAGILLVFILKR